MGAKKTSINSTDIIFIDKSTAPTARRQMAENRKNRVITITCKGVSSRKFRRKEFSFFIEGDFHFRTGNQP